MRRFFTERNLVVFLFALVLVTFTFAENDSKKIERLYIPDNSAKFQPEASPTIEAFITKPEKISSLN